MHILFVETKASVFGGQKALLARCAELDRLSIGYTIIHPFYESEFLRQATAAGLKGAIVKPDASLSPWKVIPYLIALIFGVCANNKPTLLHLEAFDSAYICAVMRRLGLIRNIPLCFTIRSERYLRFNFIDRLLLGRFDCIATNSSYSADVIAENGGIDRSKIRVTYSPIRFETISTSERRVENTPLGGEVVIGYCGSMDRRKRLDRYVTFTAQLLASRPNLKFRMRVFGEAKTLDQKAYLKAVRRSIQRNGLDAHFEFCGYSDINTVVQAIDILFCPYDNEPFGRVVPEFLYAGVPVIVVDSGGLREAGAGGAIVIEGQSEAERMASFVNVLDDYFVEPGRLSVTHELRERLYNSYSERAVVERELDIYHSMCV